MLHPSYTELMERINKDVEEGDTPIVQSRYSIVKATADRARQIIDSRAIARKIENQIEIYPTVEPVITDAQHLAMKKGIPLIDGNSDDMKPLSIAIEELYKGYVKISERAETDEEETSFTSNDINKDATVATIQEDNPAESSDDSDNDPETTTAEKKDIIDSEEDKSDDKDTDDDSDEDKTEDDD